MSTELKVEKGQRVKDLVHDCEGEVIAIVPAAEDGHHETFASVRLDDGREVHLIAGQVKPIRE